MRPEILYPLFEPVTRLPGIGPRLAQTMARLAGEKVVNALWHLPNGVIDRRYAPTIHDATPGRIATITVRIGKHEAPPSGARGRRLPYRVHCWDDTAKMVLVFFHARTDYLQRTLPEGEQRVVSGLVEHYGQTIQMTHPDHIVELAKRDSLLSVEPVYPLSAGLSLKVLGKAIRAGLERTPHLDEWQDEAFVKKNGWMPWRDALHAAHHPQSEDDLNPSAPARMRLAFDELLANQLALGLVRLNMRRAKGKAIVGDGTLRKQVLAELPFSLTTSQQRALDDILSDMGTTERMLRLLQGDVGSGKTVVAFLAMLNAVEAGGQAVLMAPTDVLVRQHLATLQPLAKAVGLEVVVLSGREKGKTREDILQQLDSGACKLAVGTHALFQDDVAFKNLNLCVIDEQHRFGVHQRLSLAAKGDAVDVMVMTATPIPRTLMLTAYGDMDVSQLTEKPAGRKPVDTRVLPTERVADVTRALERALKDGAKAYWVCPLVEESEAIDAKAAEERFDALKQQFGERVGLVHGRMRSAEKDAVMESFAHGSVDILVATTVIEVGVDVPTATVMVIEHAERFGLAQLHQLRGRIGRGDKASTCLLMYAAPLGETARQRLNIMRETDDGFRIAEEDLRLRGAGELLGTRQSGLPEFHLADLPAHDELLAAARDDCELILSRDSELTSARGRALRTLLYLFERDAAVKYLRSG